VGNLRPESQQLPTPAAIVRRTNCPEFFTFTSASASASISATPRWLAHRSSSEAESGDTSRPTASPSDTSKNQPHTTEERMNNGEGDGNQDHTLNHAALPSSASQSNAHIEGPELHTHFRGLSLTPAPSLPTEPQPRESQKTKRKRKVIDDAQARFTPVDNSCLRCRPGKKKPARECVGGGPNRACDPCRVSKVSCSKVGEYKQELLPS
jgi:hypothetical protein